MYSNKMKTVIMAGGKGTRMASVSRDIPKPMLPMAGKPVLEYEIERLREYGLNDIIITVGHLGSQITEYFGDGSNYGVRIRYYEESRPLGNAGALFHLKDELQNEFLLLNGDIVFDIDFHSFITYHEKKGGKATIFTHPNGHPYDSGLIIADEDMSVKNWIAKEDKHPRYYKNRVNAGIHVVSPEVLNRNIGKETIDLDRDILRPLAGTGELYCYDSPEYVRDMGTPDRYSLICKDYKKGIISAKNLNKKQKAIFLDRDGTINEYCGFLTNIDDFRLIDGVAEAIAKINQSEYLAIVVSNQPVIARGEVSEEELRHIHDKMETLLGEKGAYIDGLYYCPHHPDSGFPGERKEYKIQCDCRKPKPGMLIKAAEDFNIDLNASWMIGDSENDMLAGKAAGCGTILIREEKLVECDLRKDDMEQAVEIAMKGR